MYKASRLAVVEISHDGNLLLVRDNGIRLLDARTGAVMNPLEGSYGLKDGDPFSWSDVGRYVGVLSSRVATVWDTQTQTRTFPWQPEENGPPTCLVISSTAGLVAIGGGVKTRRDDGTFSVTQAGGIGLRNLDT